VVHTPWTANEVNMERKKENSNSFDEVLSPGSYIKLQADNLDLNFHSIDDGNVTEMPAKGSSLSVGPVDLEQKRHAKWGEHKGCQ